MRRFILLAAVTAALAAVVAAPGTAAASSTSTSALTTPVTGTIANAGGTLNGVLQITGFAVQNGQLVANGTLTGTLTDAAGAVIGTIDQAVTLPITSATGSCTILHLTIGPIDLNLLGLQVTTNQIVLDITAQSGPGNLLGNLLCAVSHLLDNPAAPAGGLAALLNNLLGSL